MKKNRIVLYWRLTEGEKKFVSLNEHERWKLLLKFKKLVIKGSDVTKTDVQNRYRIKENREQYQSDC